MRISDTRNHRIIGSHRRRQLGIVTGLLAALVAASPAAAARPTVTRPSTTTITA